MLKTLNIQPQEVFSIKSKSRRFKPIICSTPMIKPVQSPSDLITSPTGPSDPALY